MEICGHTVLKLCPNQSFPTSVLWHLSVVWTIIQLHLIGTLSERNVVKITCSFTRGSIALNIKADSHAASEG